LKDQTFLRLLTHDYWLANTSSISVDDKFLTALDGAFHGLSPYLVMFKEAELLSPQLKPNELAAF